MTSATFLVDESDITLQITVSLSKEMCASVFGVMYTASNFWRSDADDGSPYFSLRESRMDHAPAAHSNRRTSPKDYAVWEVRPVMALHVNQ